MNGDAADARHLAEALGDEPAAARGRSAAAAAFSILVREASKTSYGTAGPAFLQALTTECGSNIDGLLTFNEEGALSGNVKLLLLDEPFEGLAPAVTLELFGVFDRLRRHIGIVIVEHNLDLVLALADRVFALERGAVFHQGPAQPLLTDLYYRKKILWL